MTAPVCRVPTCDRPDAECVDLARTTRWPYNEWLKAKQLVPAKAWKAVQDLALKSGWYSPTAAAQVISVALIEPDELP